MTRNSSGGDCIYDCIPADLTGVLTQVDYSLTTHGHGSGAAFSGVWNLPDADIDQIEHARAPFDTRVTKT